MISLRTYKGDIIAFRPDDVINFTSEGDDVYALLLQRGSTYRNIEHSDPTTPVMYRIGKTEFQKLHDYFVTVHLSDA